MTMAEFKKLQEESKKNLAKAQARGHEKNEKV